MSYALVSKSQPQKAAVAKKHRGLRSHVPARQRVTTGAKLGTGFHTDSLLIQTKLKIGSPSDKYELEADRVAEQVIRMPESQQQRQSDSLNAQGSLQIQSEQPAIQRMGDEEEDLVRTKPITETIQRKCSACEEETTLQRMPVEENDEMLNPKRREGREATVTPTVYHGINRLRQTGGTALPTSARAFMESRLGHDFTNVKIHRSSQAANLSQHLNARAFTVGQNIFFNQGEFRPNTSAGMKLLAHELTHVVQQNRPQSRATTLQRTVSSRSTCPANVHNAPADPLASLRAIDSEAQRMALGASNVLFLESITFKDPTFGPSSTFNAYRDWFGLPQQTSSGRWRSRFRQTFATRNEAIAHEMQTFSNRFQRLHRWLTGNIRYICPGTSRYVIPGCAAGRCLADAESCEGSRTIGLCPTFWNGGDAGRSSLLLHEAIHAALRFPGHPTVTPRGRSRNPGCYQGFIDTIYNTGSLPGECSPI